MIPFAAEADYFARTLAAVGVALGAANAYIGVLTYRRGARKLVLNWKITFVRGESDLRITVVNDGPTPIVLARVDVRHWRERGGRAGRSWRRIGRWLRRQAARIKIPLPAPRVRRGDFVWPEDTTGQPVLLQPLVLQPGDPAEFTFAAEQVGRLADGRLYAAAFDVAGRVTVTELHPEVVAWARWAASRSGY